MTTYYKGFLVLSKNLIFKKLKFYSNFIDDEDMIINFNSKYEFKKEDNKTLSKCLIDLSEKKRLDESLEKVMYRIFNKIEISNIKYKRKKSSIIFEKIKDKNGNIYGKEKLTGFIFPLFNENDFKCSGNVSITPMVSDEFDFYKHLDGDMDFILKLRDNVQLCDCYLVEEKVANKNEINKYNCSKESKKYLKFYNKLEVLFNLNIFDENIFYENSKFYIHSYVGSTNVSTSNLVSCPNTSLSNNTNNSTVDTNLNNENNLINAENTSSLLPINIQLKLLEDLKNKINCLTDDDISQLRDMTGNNLDNPNTIKYILMSSDERLNFLNKPKVSLKKKI